MNPLGLLGIVFVLMCLIAICSIVLLFIIKDEKKKKFVLYVMAALGLYIAWANAQSSPLPQYLGSAVFGWILGAIGVVGVWLYSAGKSTKQQLLAKVMVIVSIVAGIVKLFLI